MRVVKTENVHIENLWSILKPFPRKNIRVVQNKILLVISPSLCLKERIQDQKF